jgi:hypothetical protein
VRDSCGCRLVADDAGRVVIGRARDALAESVSMEKVTDELCSMTVVPIAVWVTAHDPFARFVPLSHYLARRLGRQPVLVVRHDGPQVAMITDWAGFDLVDDVKWHETTLWP